MSILFSPFQLKNLELKNRFVFSACEDNLATDRGQVTDRIIGKMRRLAKGEVGLIISSHTAVHPLGRTKKHQLGIFSDEIIPGLRQLVDAVHRAGGKIIFQLGHAGAQAAGDTIGRRPLGPSASPKNDEIQNDQIAEVVLAFAAGARRAAEAGADGIQLHAAHGYLINEFLSPFFNHRNDPWGGSAENRFQFLRNVISEIRKEWPSDKVLIVKLNSNDHTPDEGITPSLAVRYAGWLAEMAIDGIEVSCGTSSLSPWNLCRGDIPVGDILGLMPEDKRAAVQEKLSMTKDRFVMEEGYNLKAASMMRPAVGRVPLFAVGGWRHVRAMEDAVHQGQTDLIPLCRPLIREPNLVKKIREGKTDQAACISCNRCFIALAFDFPVSCYCQGLPF